MSRTRQSVLSFEQVRNYDRDGIVFPISVLTADEVSKYRSIFERLEPRLGGGGYYGRMHLYFRWAYDLATHPAVLGAVENVLGPDLLVQGTLVLCKHPRDPAFVSWHQDGAYSNVPPGITTSAWIALTESKAENGCMRVVPGSHLLGPLPHRKTRDSNNLLNQGQNVEIAVDESQSVHVSLRPGEMSLHQDKIIHGSTPNFSDNKRIGFIVRFATPQLSSAPTPVIRARGGGDCSHLEVLSHPPAGNEEEGIAAWKEMVRQTK